MKNTLLGLMLLVLVGSAFEACRAEDSGRRYDAKGNFNGSYRETSPRSIRLYDAKGNYEGKIIRKGDRLVRYDKGGNYKETIKANKK